MPVDEEQQAAARVLLGMNLERVSETELYSLSRYLSVSPTEAVLDSEFTIEEIRAIAQWMETPNWVMEWYDRLKELPPPPVTG